MGADQGLADVSSAAEPTPGLVTFIIVSVAVFVSTGWLLPLLPHDAPPADKIIRIIKIFIAIQICKTVFNYTASKWPE